MADQNLKEERDEAAEKKRDPKKDAEGRSSVLASSKANAPCLILCGNSSLTTSFRTRT